MLRNRGIKKVSGHDIGWSWVDKESLKQNISVRQSEREGRTESFQTPPWNVHFVLPWNKVISRRHVFYHFNYFQLLVLTILKLAHLHQIRTFTFRITKSDWEADTTHLLLLNGVSITLLRWADLSAFWDLLLSRRFRPLFAHTEEKCKVRQW